MEKLADKVIVVHDKRCGSGQRNCNIECENIGIKFVYKIGGPRPIHKGIGRRITKIVSRISVTGPFKKKTTKKKKKKKNEANSVHMLQVSLLRVVNHKII